MNHITLPVELYRCIAENADRAGLRALLTVSRVFQFEAERLLYRRFSPSDSIDDICQHLLAIPRFWPLIQHAKILIRDDDVVDRDWEHLASIFPKLVNLVVLEFIERRELFDGEPIECGNMFQGSTFQLRSLSCHFTLDPEFCEFLQTQRSITYFNWYPYEGPLYEGPSGDFPIDALPILGALDAGIDDGANDPEIIPAILVGRPVTHVRGNWRLGLAYFTPVVYAMRRAIASTIYKREH
jgi:hypothetical protein